LNRQIRKRRLLFLKTEKKNSFSAAFFGLITLLIYSNVFSSEKLSRYEALSGRKLQDSKSEWDQKFLSEKYIFGKTPAKFLKENAHLINKRSKVLDMGMGEGRNAVFLATKGHNVIGIDISSVAIEKANALAQEFSTQIKGVVASLDNYRIKEGSFDVILAFYYVDRNLIDKMKSWLKPGGLIFYEANTVEKLKEGKLIDKSYLVEKGEIKRFFHEMKILKFEEPNDGSYRSSIVVRK